MNKDSFDLKWKHFTASLPSHQVYPSYLLFQSHAYFQEERNEYLDGQWGNSGIQSMTYLPHFVTSFQLSNM